MNWRDVEAIPAAPDGTPMFLAGIELVNDKNTKLASVIWFVESGPFYAHAVDPKDFGLIRRIGPCTSLDGAKQACVNHIEGKLDRQGAAAYRKD